MVPFNTWRRLSGVDVMAAPPVRVGFGQPASYRSSGGSEISSEIPNIFQGVQLEGKLCEPSRSRFAQHGRRQRQEFLEHLVGRHGIGGIAPDHGDRLFEDPSITEEKSKAGGWTIQPAW